MPDGRKDMSVQTGKHAICGILRPFFLATVPLQCHGFKHFLLHARAAFSGTLLRRVDVQRQHLTDAFALLAGVRQGDGRVGTQCNTGFFAINTVFKIPETGTAWFDQQIQTVGIGDFKGFIRRLEGADFCVGKGYMGVTPLSN